MLQDSADEADIDADRDGTCALFGTASGELNEDIAGDVGNAHGAEGIIPEPEQGGFLAATKRAPQLDEVRECFAADRGLANRGFTLVDAALLVACPGVGIGLQPEGPDYSVALPADADPPDAGRRLFERRHGKYPGWWARMDAL